MPSSPGPHSPSLILRPRRALRCLECHWGRRYCVDHDRRMSAVPGCKSSRVDFISLKPGGPLLKEEGEEAAKIQVRVWIDGSDAAPIQPCEKGRQTPSGMVWRARRCPRRVEFSRESRKAHALGRCDTQCVCPQRHEDALPHGARDKFQFRSIRAKSDGLI